MPFNNDLNWIEDNEDLEGSPSPIPSGVSNRVFNQLLENTLDNQSRISSLEGDVSTINNVSSGKVTLEQYYQAISELEDAKINYANVQGASTLVSSGKISDPPGSISIAFDQSNESDWVDNNFIISAQRLRSGIGVQPQDAPYASIVNFRYYIGRLIVKCNPSAFPIKIYLWNNIDEDTVPVFPGGTYVPPQIFDYGVGVEELNSTSSFLHTKINYVMGSLDATCLRAELGVGASINSNFEMVFIIDGVL